MRGGSRLYTEETACTRRTRHRHGQVGGVLPPYKRGQMADCSASRYTIQAAGEGISVRPREGPQGRVTLTADMNSESRDNKF